jgi:hypothetical protein
MSSITESYFFASFDLITLIAVQTLRENIHDLDLILKCNYNVKSTRMHSYSQSLFIENLRYF